MRSGDGWRGGLTTVGGGASSTVGGERSPGSASSSGPRRQRPGGGGAIGGAAAPVAGPAGSPRSRPGRGWSSTARPQRGAGRALRSWVSSASSAQPVAQRRPHPADLGQQHPGVVRPRVGVAARWPGRPARRDRAGSARRCANVDGGGTSVCTWAYATWIGRLARCAACGRSAARTARRRRCRRRSGRRPCPKHQLGRQVGHGADQQPLGRGRGLRGDRLGQPEVGDLELAARTDQARSPA